MKLVVTGLDEIIKKYDTAHKIIDERVKEVLHRYGKLMVEYARNNHRYTNRSGELTRSISYRVDQFTFEFFLDGNMTLVSGGRKYSTFQHDGTYEDYEPSVYSERYSNTTGRSGIKHDHFMVNAFERYRDSMIVDIKKAFVGVLK